MSYRLLVTILLINFTTTLKAEELTTYELDLLHSQFLGSKSGYFSVDAQKHLTDGQWKIDVRVVMNPFLSTREICKSPTGNFVFEYLENDIPNYNSPKDSHLNTMAWLFTKNENGCKSYGYAKKMMVINLVTEVDLLNILQNTAVLVEEAFVKKPKIRTLFSKYLNKNELEVSRLEIKTNRMHDNVYSALISFGLNCHGLSIDFELEKEKFNVQNVYELVC